MEKCMVCDGYGTRPHRAKPSKFTKCKPCGGLGVVETQVGPQDDFWYLKYQAFPVSPTSVQLTGCHCGTVCMCVCAQCRPAVYTGDTTGSITIIGTEIPTILYQQVPVPVSSIYWRV